MRKKKEYIFKHKREDVKIIVKAYTEEVAWDYLHLVAVDILDYNLLK